VAKTDRPAAHHVLHVKGEAGSYAGVNDWCDLRGNDGKGDWEEDMALRLRGQQQLPSSFYQGVLLCSHLPENTSHGNSCSTLTSLTPKLPTP